MAPEEWRDVSPAPEHVLTCDGASRLDAHRPGAREQLARQEAAPPTMRLAVRVVGSRWRRRARPVAAHSPLGHHRHHDGVPVASSPSAGRDGGHAFALSSSQVVIR